MTAYQRTLNGNTIALGTIQDRIRCLMEGDEGCRNHDMEMLVALWMQDGMQYVIPPEFHEPLVSFLTTTATNAKRALRWWEELQNG